MVYARCFLAALLIVAAVYLLLQGQDQWGWFLGAGIFVTPMMPAKECDADEDFADDEVRR